MRAKGLIDTGAILALLYQDDRWHERCLEAFGHLRVPLATSAAVLAELFHLVGHRPHEIASAWGFVRSGAIMVLPIGDADLPTLEALMKRYADRPMGFAAATLVHLATRESLTTVFTVDHADFETYRIGARRRFRILPGR